MGSLGSTDAGGAARDDADVGVAADGVLFAEEATSAIFAPATRSWRAAPAEGRWAQPDCDATTQIVDKDVKTRKCADNNLGERVYDCDEGPRKLRTRKFASSS